MTTTTIYHNPHCSKSRHTLALLEERGIDPDIVLYLETPPTEEQLKKLLAMLGISPRDLLRKSEDIYKSLNLQNPELSDAELIAAMINNPKLIERPIVVRGNKAVLGRPPENVLDLMDG